MKVFLLGASGLLGHNVLAELSRQGHEVVALLRSELHPLFPKDIRFEKRHFQGSLAQIPYPQLLSAARGCDAIVNCAGTTNMSLLHLDDYLPMNCDLCASLLRLMDDLSIPVLVHVSSANTIGIGTPQHPSDESVPIAPPFSDSFYAQSKLMGERLLTEAAAKYPQRHIIILNPGFMVGPFDARPSSGMLLLAAYRKSLMVVPSGGKSFVSVQAVAEAVANALSMGVSGCQYLLTGESLSLRDFYLKQAAVCGYRQRVVVLPKALVLLAGRVGDMLRAMGICTQLSSRNVRQLLVSEYYTNTRATTQLRLPSIPIEQAIADFFRCYKSQKKK